MWHEQPSDRVGGNGCHRHPPSLPDWTAEDDMLLEALWNTTPTAPDEPRDDEDDAAAAATGIDPSAPTATGPAAPTAAPSPTGAGTGRVPDPVALAGWVAVMIGVGGLLVAWLVESLAR